MSRRRRTTTRTTQVITRSLAVGRRQKWPNIENLSSHLVMEICSKCAWDENTHFVRACFLFGFSCFANVELETCLLVWYLFKRSCLSFCRSRYLACLVNGLFHAQVNPTWPSLYPKKSFAISNNIYCLTQIRKTSFYHRTVGEKDHCIAVANLIKALRL